MYGRFALMANAKKNATGPTAEVAAPDSYKPDTLRSITTWDQALEAAMQAFGQPVAVAHEELGDGFAVLPTDKKDRLIGVPLFLMEWRFADGDNGRFVSIRAVAQNEDAPGVRKYIINDGSTGICQQLAEYQEQTGRTGGLMVRNGLRRSDYTYTNDNGEDKAASTFYLDTSA